MVNTGRDRDFLMESLIEHSDGLLPDYIGVVEREVYAHDSGAYLPMEHWNQASRERHSRLFDQHAGLIEEVAHWIRSSFTAEVYEDAHSPVCIIARNNEDADHIHAYVDQVLEPHQQLAWVRNDIYARFGHSEIHKGSILEKVADQHGIGPTQIAVAGDHFNDLPMLDRRYASHLIAPSNSIPEVREHMRLIGGLLSPLEAGHGVLDGLTSLFGETC